MEEIRNFIDMVAQGNNVEAKSALEDLISARAFDALEDKKRELSSSLFSTAEQENTEA